MKPLLFLGKYFLFLGKYFLLLGKYFLFLGKCFYFLGNICHFPGYVFICCESLSVSPDLFLVVLVVLVDHFGNIQTELAPAPTHIDKEPVSINTTA